MRSLLHVTNPEVNSESNKRKFVLYRCPFRIGWARVLEHQVACGLLQSRARRFVPAVTGCSTSQITPDPEEWERIQKKRKEKKRIECDCGAGWVDLGVK